MRSLSYQIRVRPRLQLSHRAYPGLVPRGVFPLSPIVVEACQPPALIAVSSRAMLHARLRIRAQVCCMVESSEVGGLSSQEGLSDLPHR